jgi:hypothetical protein
MALKCRKASSRVFARILEAGLNSGTVVSHYISIDLCYELHGSVMCVVKAVLLILQTPVIRIRIIVSCILHVRVLAKVGRETIDLRFVLMRAIFGFDGSMNLCSGTVDSLKFSRCLRLSSCTIGV